ncbi:hypothetical protein [Vibrio sp. AND4]|nr:hypothetical protein [Vibrio sp. AND4]EDP57570.1 hypothetical protein AND4_08807 [Vibrio sp. AND4]
MQDSQSCRDSLFNQAKRGKQRGAVASNRLLVGDPDAGLVI